MKVPFNFLFRKSDKEDCYISNYDLRIEGHLYKSNSKITKEQLYVESILKNIGEDNNLEIRTDVYNDDIVVITKVLDG